MMNKTVQTNSTIRWRYQLQLSNGSVFEQHSDESGDLLHLGKGELHPNIESVLPSLQEGEKTIFIFSPEEAFGYRDNDAIQTLDPTLFSQEQPPEPGQIISFTIPSGQEIPGHILQCDQQGVVVDFNHPLAGQNITLSVEIVAIVD